MVPVGSGNRRCAHRDQRAKLRVYTFAIENWRVRLRDSGSTGDRGSVEKVDFPMRLNLVAMSTDSIRTANRQIVCKI